jgi:hypothetical protein
MLFEPSGFSIIRKMQMVLSFATRQDWWLEVFSRVKGIDFDETFAHVARLKSLRILLAYASHHKFKLQQLDVKSAFLNGPLNELVFVKKPL